MFRPQGNCQTNTAERAQFNCTRMRNFYLMHIFSAPMEMYGTRTHNENINEALEQSLKMLNLFFLFLGIA